MQNFDLLIQSAWQSIQQDNLNDAMTYAKQAHTLQPESSEVAHVLGLIASRQGQHAIALPLLQKTLSTGGTSARKLRDMAEALYSAGHPQAALAPLNDALNAYGESSALLGLKSAIEIALERWQDAEASALQAIALEPNLLAWELNASFAQLIQLNLKDGFKNATARTENLHPLSRCPAVHHAEPCEIWLQGEQGLGDTLFYLRFVPPLTALGWKFHLQCDRKLVPLLEQSHYFLSVKEQNKCPHDGFWLNVGELALMAQQLGVENIPTPLPLVPDAKLVAKFKSELAAFGPPPYIAVTWRGGPKGRQQRAGINMLEKTVAPKWLGQQLANTHATIVNVQRLPIVEETIAFHSALGKKSLDYTALNNHLGGMLALLSVVDDYVTVSNTNLHLRESVQRPSQVLVNRPFKDWRWLHQGDQSPWYPKSTVLRQAADGEWQALQISIAPKTPDNASSNNQSTTNALQTADLDAMAAQLHQQTVNEGWQALQAENISLAIQKAQSVLKAAPQSASALHLLGWAAASDCKFDLAIGILQQACTLQPSNGIFVRDFIRTLGLSGQYSQALQVADLALSDPQLKSKSAIHYAKAAICVSLGENQTALHHYEQCLAISPNYLDALDFGGMLRMKLGSGYARLGFKQNSARKQCQHPSQIDVYCCPVLKGNIQGLRILVTRDMGLGDELTYLRYLPWLVKAGANITYWCGAKLLPVLERQNLGIHLIPDSQPRPNPDTFDLAFIVSELSYAGEHLGAPEIAPPLPLTPDPVLVEKWRNWLSQQGPAPYIGFNWRAGVANSEKMASITKLSKAIDAQLFAQALSSVQGTFISLQRNITQQELNAFSQHLQSPVFDASGLTDSLDDLLALLSLLDANVGVSNTNMHLRAGLGKSSDVLVQNPGGDWRWGVAGAHSEWFTDCTVYRQDSQGDWKSSLQQLQNTLVARFEASGDKPADTEKSASPAQPISQTTPSLTKRIIWVSAGEITGEGVHLYSVLESARERVIAPALALNKQGWTSTFINEQLAEVMGGWNGNSPHMGDIVVFSKVITPHALTLIKDAKHRGACTVVDVFNSFTDQKKRADFQLALMREADVVISIPELSSHWESSQQNIDFFLNSVDALVSSDTVANQKMLAWTVAFSQIAEEPFKKNHKKQTLGSRVGILNHEKLKGDYPTQATILVASDKFYFREHGPALMASAAKAGHDVHFHVVNPHDKDFELIKNLKEAASRISEQIAKVTFSYETTNLEGLTQDEKLTYYACNRFLVAPLLLEKSCNSLIITDIDSLIMRRLDVFDNIDTGLFIREAIQGQGQAVEEGTKVAAGLVYFSKNAIQFADKLAKSIYSSEKVAWFLDQVCLHHTFLKYQELLGNFITLNNQFIDWNFSDYAYIWSGKGSRKLNNNRYLDAKAKFFNLVKIEKEVSKSSAVILNNLVWVTAGKLDNSLGYISSTLASTRYRVLLPAANLGPLGWQSQIINEAELAQHGWGEIALAQGQIVIVSKSHQPDLLPQLQLAKQQGCHIVVDYCDNHFERPDAIGQHQHALLQLADHVVTSAAELQSYIENRTNTPVTLITDCFEGQKNSAKFAPGRVLKLLWFGSHTNHDTLASLFQSLSTFATKQEIALELVTLHSNGDEAAREVSTKHFTVTYTEWNPANLKAALERCDIVVIPTLQVDHKAGKSPNRVFESIWAGRYVVAGELAAYQAFSAYASICDDLIAGIQWALQHPDEVIEKINQGQQYIIVHHTPKRIGELWHKALNSMTSNASLDSKHPASAVTVNQLPIRLNLGCGDKHIAGYINVDLVVNQGAKQPDVICDLKVLTPFESNSVDEILSVHVVEHFWRWEVLDVLKEWVRVLKPGGKMIVECPNLIAACELFLKNPELATTHGTPEHERTMWVFYGDPGWKDPYMVHRWGYTPTSLAQLLQQAGLVNIRQEPAQFKKREPRDMRLVAEKP